MTCWIPFAVSGGPGHLITGGAWGGLLVVTILMCAIPPRGWTDQLFLFEHGLILANPQEPEPAVMRWDDLDSVSMMVRSGYDDDYISSCEIRGRSGRSMTLDGSFPGVLTEIAATAEELVARWLLSGLIARYDVGERVSFPGISVDWSGLDTPGASRASPRSFGWPEIARIEMRLHGHRLAITGASRSTTNVTLGGEPNDFLAQHVIMHAAGRAGVAVTAE